MNISKGAWDSDIIDKIFLHPTLKEIKEKLSVNGSFGIATALSVTFLIHYLPVGRRETAVSEI